MAEKNDDISKRVLTLKRTFDAPIDLVWEAWTQPEHIAQWWAPKGMEVSVIEHNFKMGGRWKYTAAMPDGSEFVSDGVYAEIIEFQKIVSSANIGPMTQHVEMRALFEKNGDKTNFTFSIVHPTEEYKIQQEKMGFYNGWGTVFDRLGGYVKALVK
jgi:uncharacterized protein YndB with AHSA1/START domain